jgi:hypothetical protein
MKLPVEATWGAAVMAGLAANFRLPAAFSLVLTGFWVIVTLRF